MSETARWTGPAPPHRGRPAQQQPGGRDGANLADILERVLDKGIVIAGDIQVNLLDIELLTIKIRLVVASVDRAKEMGIDWWERDPTLSAGRRELEDENRELRARIEALEQGGRGLPLRDGDDPPEADGSGFEEDDGSDQATLDEDRAEEGGLDEDAAEEDAADRDPADRDPADRDPADRDPADRDRAGEEAADREPAGDGRDRNGDRRRAAARRRPGARRSSGPREARS